METSSIVMMIVGMAIIWGGLVTSVAFAVKKSRKN